MDNLNSQPSALSHAPAQTSRLLPEKLERNVLGCDKEKEERKKEI